MSFYQRITAISVGLAIVIAGLVLFGFPESDIEAVAFAPTGQQVIAGTTIRVTFSRNIDRVSVEESFQLDPPINGRIFWEERTLVFQPDQRLTPGITYNVRFAAGMLDARGRPNAEEFGWQFRTREPRLVLLREDEQGNGEFWLSELSGAPRLVFSAGEPVFGFAVSPFGDRLIYTVLRDEQRFALLQLDLEQAQSREFVDDLTASASTPAWASAGDYLAFERRALVDGSLGAPRIWFAQADETALGPLVGGEAINFAPSWSPDGNRIAFIDGETQALSVYDFFSDMVRTLPDQSGEPPLWSPDGQSLIYSSAEIGDAGPLLRLRRVNLGTLQIRDLTPGGAAELAPALSPDGLQVVYTRRDPNGPAGPLWLVSAVGGEPQALTESGNDQDTAPIWSPSGTEIAFIRTPLENPLERAAWLVEVESGMTRQILDRVIQVGWGL